MATGYTHKIKDGQTFNEFVWGCARAFGALVSMREDPSDAPIPIAFSISSSHNDELSRAYAAWNELQAITLKEAERRAISSYQTARTHHVQNQKDTATLRASYVAMINQVKAWVPPSPEHVELKTFMLQQLETSLDFDGRAAPAPNQLSGVAWLVDQTERGTWSISYHTKENQLEHERVASRNLWLSQLRASIPPK